MRPRPQTVKLKERRRMTLSLSKTKPLIEAETPTQFDTLQLSKINIFDYSEGVNTVRYPTKTIESHPLCLSQRLTIPHYPPFAGRLNTDRHEIKKNKISFSQYGQKPLDPKRKFAKRMGH